MPTLPQLNQTSRTGVAYCQLHDGLEEGADQGGLYAKKSYLCAWVDRWKFLKELRGSTTITGGSGGKITRLLPAVYPDNNYLYAFDAKVTPFGNNRGLGPNQITYDYAKIDVTFKTADYNFDNSQSTGEPAVDSVTFGTVDLAFSGEFLSLPTNHKFQFVTSGKASSQSQGVLVPNIEYSITRHQIPFLPVTIIKGLMGRINAAAWYGFDPETVMFVGGSARRSATTEGLQAWDLDYRFLWRPYSWNKALTELGTWDTIMAGGVGPPPLTGGSKLYLTGDLSLLP